MFKNTILGIFFAIFFILLRKTDAGSCIGRSVSASHLPSDGTSHRHARSVDENRSGHDSGGWHFGYQNIAEWGQHYPECNGRKQSPIDLDSNLMTQLKVKQPFVWSGYQRTPNNITIVNNGHTVQLSGCWEGGNTPYISGGSLMGEYAFEQLHFHWGAQNDYGSEHTINNIGLPLEMHMVHYKKSYGSLNEAMKYDDGLAVVGILFKIDGSGNSGIKRMQRFYKAFINPHHQITIKPFPLTKFQLDFPGEYVSYLGSLTTPPCKEIVTWIIPANPRPINQKQIDVFRRINLSGGDDHNNRPVMPLNGRMVYYIDYR